jgi:hypothetical protein
VQIHIVSLDDTAHRGWSSPRTGKKLTCVMLTLRLIAIVCIVQTQVAVATPPENANPNSALSGWFKSLRQPGTQHPCCSVSDCRATAYEIRNGHFEIKLDGWLYVVPDEVVLHRADNPTGEAVVCYSYSAFGPPMEHGQIRTTPQDTVEILCFIPPQPTT